MSATIENFKKAAEADDGKGAFNAILYGIITAFHEGVKHQGRLRSPTWPTVTEFALAMESKLEQNRDKGDQEGWLKMTVEELGSGMMDEISELEQALSANAPIHAVVNECADVANFAMMIADNYSNRHANQG